MIRGVEGNGPIALHHQGIDIQFAYLREIHDQLGDFHQDFIQYLEIYGWLCARTFGQYLVYLGLLNYPPGKSLV